MNDHFKIQLASLIKTVHRQGDVPVARVDDPEILAMVMKEGKLRSPSERGYIVRYGESTGHMHAVVAEPGVKVVDWGDTLWVVAERTWSLSHDEHGTITLAPGVYTIGEMVEWSDENEPRRVTD